MISLDNFSLCIIIICIIVKDMSIFNFQGFFSSSSNRLPFQLSPEYKSDQHRKDYWKEILY